MAMSRSPAADGTPIDAGRPDLAAMIVPLGRALTAAELPVLRAHGLIQKVASTHRYQLTPQGRTSLAAILAAQQASTQQLTQMAA